MPVITPTGGGGGGGLTLLGPFAVAFNSPGIDASPGIALVTIPADRIYLGAYVTVQTSWDANVDSAQIQLNAPDGENLSVFTVAANWATVSANASTPAITGSINAPTAGFTLADQTRLYRDTSPWVLHAIAASVVGATMGAATITVLIG